jgi:hypothetical protein
MREYHKNGGVRLEIWYQRDWRGNHVHLRAAEFYSNGIMAVEHGRQVERPRWWMPTGESTTDTWTVAEFLRTDNGDGTFSEQAPDIRRN